MILGTRQGGEIGLVFAYQNTPGGDVLNPVCQPLPMVLQFERGLMGLSRMAAMIKL